MEEKATITFKSETTWGYSKSPTRHYILIDGTVAGTIKNQETKVIEVTPGTHVVEILQAPSIRFSISKNISRSTIKIMEVNPGENSLCEIVTPSRLTTSVVSMFVTGTIYLILWNQIKHFLKLFLDEPFYKTLRRSFEDQLFNLGLNWDHLSVIDSILFAFSIISSMLLLGWIIEQISNFGIYGSNTVFKEDFHQLVSKK